MDAVSLLTEAQQAGLVVEAVGGDLRVRGPRTAAAMVERLRAHKDAILEALTPGDGPLPHADRETARFLRVAVPDADGMGWHDPATRAPVVPPAKYFQNPG